MPAFHAHAFHDSVDFQTLGVSQLLNEHSAKGGHARQLTLQRLPQNANYFLNFSKLLGATREAKVPPPPATLASAKAPLPRLMDPH